MQEYCTMSDCIDQNTHLFISRDSSFFIQATICFGKESKTKF